MQVLFDLVKTKKRWPDWTREIIDKHKQGLSISAVRAMNARKSDNMKLKSSYIIINLWKPFRFACWDLQLNHDKSMCGISQGSHTKQGWSSIWVNPSPPTLPCWVNIEAGSYIVMNRTTQLWFGICTMLNSRASMMKQANINPSKGSKHSSGALLK